MMKRFSAICLTLSITWATGSMAFSVEDLRKLAYNSDVEAVNTEVAHLQELYLDGAIDAAQIREMFDAFATSDRRMIAFIEAWLIAYPDSALSNTARLRSLETLAWSVRGTGFNNTLHPAARKAFNGFVSELVSRTQMAIASDPDLVPAADAVIRIGNLTRKAGNPWTATDHIMRTRPNWQTVENMLFVAHPGYGGDTNTVDRICTEFASLLPGTGTDYVFRCKMTGYTLYHVEDNLSWLVENIDTSDDPYLEKYRARLAVFFASKQVATPSQLRLARTYYERADQTDMSAVQAYEDHVAFPNDWPALSERVTRNAIAEAERILEHDPYNHAALETAAIDTAMGQFRSDGSRLSVRLRPPLDPDMQREYARRQLVSRPFDPWLWSEYAMHLYLQPKPEHFHSGDQYLENAAFFSGHDPGFLAGIMHRRMMQFEFTQIAAMEDLPPEWEELAASMDVPTRVLCPFLRAYRLFEATCQADEGQDACIQNSDQELLMHHIAETARALPSCQFAAFADVDALKYDPVGLPLYHSQLE